MLDVDKNYSPALHKSGHTKSREKRKRACIKKKIVI